jgi:hypothetical protein
MSEYRHRLDRYLGLGGIGLGAATLAWRLFGIAVPGQYDWLDSIAAVMGAVVVVWLVTVTLRHRLAYRHGAGRSLLLVSWVIAAAIVGVDVAQGAGDGYIGFLDWVGSVAGSFHVHSVPLAVPLVVASLAILKDARVPAGSPKRESARSSLVR